MPLQSLLDLFLYFSLLLFYLVQVLSPISHVLHEQHLHLLIFQPEALEVGLLLPGEKAFWVSLANQIDSDFLLDACEFLMY